jgi:hypothetical protein
MKEDIFTRLVSEEEAEEGGRHGLAGTKEGDSHCSSREDKQRFLDPPR